MNRHLAAAFAALLFALPVGGCATLPGAAGTAATSELTASRSLYAAEAAFAGASAALEKATDTGVLNGAAAAKARAVYAKARDALLAARAAKAAGDTVLEAARASEVIKGAIDMQQAAASGGFGASSF